MMLWKSISTSNPNKGSRLSGWKEKWLNAVATLILFDHVKDNVDDKKGACATNTSAANDKAESCFKDLGIRKSSVGQQ
jgi:hypothetical protein